jgi:hypothetical protein
MADKRNLFVGDPEIPLPLRVVQAKRGVGSFLTIDLASRDEAERPDVRWMIWVYLCDWVLMDRDGTEILNSDCSDNAIYEQALKKLINVKLLEAGAEDNNETCRLFFSDDFQLFMDDASDVYGPDKDMFKIFRNDSFYAFFKPRIGFVHG